MQSEITPAAPPATALLWDKDRTAEALSVRPDTVVQLHRVGQLRGVLCGKHLRWKPSDVRRFVEGLGLERADTA